MGEKVILQVIGGLNRGGAETMLMNIYRNMDKHYRFVFLSYRPEDTQDDYEQEILSNGDRIIKLPVARVHNPVTFYMDLMALMRENHFDCVHCHTLFNSGVVMLAAKHSKIPVRITHSHSTGIMKRNNLINRMYFAFSRYLIRHNTTMQIACTQQCGEYLFGGDFQGVILNNGIDIDKFNTTTQPMLSMHPDLARTDILKLAAISSFYEVKNHTFMIKVADCLRNRGVAFKLFFVGRGPLEEKLRQEVQQYGLEEYIIFLGVISNVHELLPAIDVVLMPSLYEGLPVSLIEAQASGTPAVISNKISPDVNLGLDLITFLDIDGNYDQWADTILAMDKARPDQETITETINKSGYNVKENVKIVSALYDGKTRV